MIILKVIMFYFPCPIRVVYRLVGQLAGRLVDWLSMCHNFLTGQIVPHYHTIVILKIDFRISFILYIIIHPNISTRFYLLIEKVYSLCIPYCQIELTVNSTDGRNDDVRTDHVIGQCRHLSDWMMQLQWGTRAFFLYVRRFQPNSIHNLVTTTSLIIFSKFLARTVS